MSSEMILPHPIFVPVALGFFLNFLSTLDASGEIVKNAVILIAIILGITWMRLLN